MKASNNFFDLLEQFEGYISCPYRDSVGIPTIGIGTTVYPNGNKVKMTDTCISKEEAIEYARNHVKGDEETISEQLPSINQNQFDALLSFVYNVGRGAFLKSTLLKKAKIDPNDSSISAEFVKWNKAGGKELKGLSIRRKKEADLYFK